MFLISVTLLYLSTILSCISAIDEDTSEPETIAFDENFLALSLSLSLCLCFLSFFRFFRFRFLAYWDHYCKFAEFDSLKPLKKY